MRRFHPRFKGVNVNKPYKVERERRERDRQFGEPSKKNAPRHPPGLKGKEIGLYYRDRKKEVEKIPLVVGISRQRLHEYENDLLQADEIYSRKNENVVCDFLHTMKSTFEEKLNEINIFKMKNVENVNQHLLEELQNKMKDHKLRDIFQNREKLPSYSMKDEIVNLINNNQIVVITGATGCGKTTQIVQYVLDDYILRNVGSLCNIICTQPRRISAYSVADRVAYERGEELGESVGYAFRLEKTLPKRKHGSIQFLTAGLLLEWLHFMPVLNDFSHLFIDEVHERNMDSDFLLALIKYILPKRPDLKVILMSATLNSTKFSKYFDNVPCLEIPGLTFPVKEYYLEDILHKVHFIFPKCKFKDRDIDPVFKNFVIPYVNNLSREKYSNYEMINQLRNPMSEVINFDFIARVISYICEEEPEGAILVFVTGLSDIQTLNTILKKSRLKRFTSIFPMHSLIPIESQRQAFRKPPPNVRKIIISTSIAETGITVPDVRYVIDCGKIKAQDFNVSANVKIIEPQWVSMANATQRKGRAGRVQSGKCFKLYTRAREESFCSEFPPEIQRTSLENVILKAKTLHIKNVEPFLEKTLDPANPEMVVNALKLLRTMNILDNENQLTALGYHVAKLPADPHLSKMIIMAAIFSCLDPILSIAASLNDCSMFRLTLDNEKEIAQIRKSFAETLDSDHLVSCNIFYEWERAVNDGYEHEFLNSNYLSGRNLKYMNSMKRQFAGYLYEMKFLQSQDPSHPQNNMNSDNKDLLKAVVYSGLYPNIAKIKRIIRGKADPKPREVFLKTIDNFNVNLQSKSLLLENKFFESPFIAYHSKVKTTKIFCNDGTVIKPAPLLLFGGKLGKVNTFVDDTIEFQSERKSAVFMEKLQQKMSRVFDEILSKPRTVQWNKNEAHAIVLKSVIKLISSNDLVFIDYKGP